MGRNISSAMKSGIDAPFSGTRTGGQVSIAGLFGQGQWKAFDPGLISKNYTWPVPAGVTSIRIRCFGGGAWYDAGGTASCLGVSATGGSLPSGYTGGQGGQGSGGDAPYNYKGGKGGTSLGSVSSPSYGGYEYCYAGGGGSANIFGNGGDGGEGDTASGVTLNGKQNGKDGASGGGGGQCYEGWGRGGDGFIGSGGMPARNTYNNAQAISALDGITFRPLDHIDSFRCGGGGGAGTTTSGLGGGFCIYSASYQKTTINGGIGGGGFGGGAQGEYVSYGGRGGGGFAMGVREVTPGQEISIVCGVRAAVIIEW